MFCFCFLFFKKKQWYVFCWYGNVSYYCPESKCIYFQSHHHHIQLRVTRIPSKVLGLIVANAIGAWKLDALQKKLFNTRQKTGPPEVPYSATREHRRYNLIQHLVVSVCDQTINCKLQTSNVSKNVIVSSSKRKHNQENKSLFRMQCLSY